MSALATSANSSEFPVGSYDVIVADPPWPYWGSGTKWAAAAKYYPLMTEEEIAGLPMGELLAPRGVLFLWATSPKLDVAMRCIAAWGLTFLGVEFVWNKTKADGTPIGAQGVRPTVVKPLAEFVLGASKVKKPMPVADEGVVQTVFAPRSIHSAKPPEVMDRIERLYPEASRIELFARQRRDGWDAWS